MFSHGPQKEKHERNIQAVCLWVSLVFKGKDIALRALVFEEQECNSPRFCLAATHPTNEKMPTFKASWRIFKFSLWPVRSENSCEFATNGLFKRVSFLSFVLVFTLKQLVCVFRSRGGGATYTVLRRVDSVTISFNFAPGTLELFSARLSRCSLVRFTAKVYCSGACFKMVCTYCISRTSTVYNILFVVPNPLLRVHSWRKFGVF